MLGRGLLQVDPSERHRQANLRRVTGQSAAKGISPSVVRRRAFDRGGFCEPVRSLGLGSLVVAAVWKHAQRPVALR